MDVVRKLVYLIASTLDGFIADTARADPSGTIFELEGDHITALATEYPETIPHHVRSHLGLDDAPNRRFDTVLEGRRSFEVGLAYGIADAYPHLHHLVFSTTLTAVEDPRVEVVSTDPVARVRELKAEDGLDLWLCGGGSLAAALREEIDEIHLKLNPVVLGTGAPLFDPAPGAVPSLERYSLRSSRTFDSGVALMIYARSPIHST